MFKSWTEDSKVKKSVRSHGNGETTGEKTTSVMTNFENGHQLFWLLVTLNYKMYSKINED